jgi:glycerophosphoryl diester phosphodiesterase
VTQRQVMVSAHAGRGALVTRAGYQRTVASGADYVEVDIRATADGEMVAAHDPVLPDGHPVAALTYRELIDRAGYDVPRAADVLTVIRGRARGHLDLKVTGAQDALVRLALDILGPGQFVVTTADDAVAAAITARFPDRGAVPVALSLGVGTTPARWLPTRLRELRPLPRVRACGANWVALHHRLARAGVARQCRQRGLGVLVWTVNGNRDLRYWLARDRADVVITDRPERALELRAELRTRP